MTIFLPYMETTLLAHIHTVTSIIHTFIFNPSCTHIQKHTHKHSQALPFSLSIILPDKFLQYPPTEAEDSYQSVYQCKSICGCLVLLVNEFVTAECGSHWVLMLKNISCLRTGPCGAAQHSIICPGFSHPSSRNKIYQKSAEMGAGTNIVILLQVTLQTKHLHNQEKQCYGFEFYIDFVISSFCVQHLC